MESSEACEGGYVGSSWYEAAQIRVPERLGEMKVPNMVRWSVFPRFNFRAPALKSGLIELYLREEVVLAPVDPCAGNQRADSQGIDPQYRL